MSPPFLCDLIFQERARRFACFSKLQGLCVGLGEGEKGQSRVSKERLIPSRGWRRRGQDRRPKTSRLQDFCMKLETGVQICQRYYKVRRETHSFCKMSLCACKEQERERESLAIPIIQFPLLRIGKAINCVLGEPLSAVSRVRERNKFFLPLVRKI